MPSSVEGRASTSSGSTAFKDQIDAALVDRLAIALAVAGPDVDVESFRRVAVGGLDGLELKARIAHVASALATALPAEFPSAVAVVDRVLTAPAEGPGGGPAGLRGWDLWAVTEWVALAGRDHPGDALELLARLTRHASGEFAIRPFIDDDPDGVRARLTTWVQRDDEHVRRLVSEGTRPKLPWAPKLAITATDPAYAVGLLDRLVDDGSEYVRRSVSNHLNDLCRVDAALALGSPVAGPVVPMRPPRAARRRPPRSCAGSCVGACGHWSRPATPMRCDCSATTPTWRWAPSWSCTPRWW
jgi:3-methyladenine DNA glycosylase AlkC